MKSLNLYLICSTDSLETAFFCGTAPECAAVLGLKMGTFWTMLSKKQRVWGFFHIERVKIHET